MLLRRWSPAAAALALAFGGCAAIKNSLKYGAGPEGAKQREARDVVRALASNFQDGQAQPLFALFDAEDFPDWEDFRYDAQQFMLRNRNISLDIVIDSIVSDDEDTSVQAHWNRSYVTAGKTRLDQGTCELILHPTDSGLKLAIVDGANPFL